MRLGRAVRIVAWPLAASVLAVAGWASIHSVINDVGGNQPRLLSADNITALLPPSNGATTAPSPQSGPRSTPTTPTHRLSAAPKPEPPTSASSLMVSPPTHTSTPGPVGRTNPSPTPPGPALPGASPASPADNGNSATFVTPGGTVAATCKGTTLSLDFARPNDGWQLEVDKRGPEKIEVHFTSSTPAGTASGTDDDGTDSEVKLVCSAGVPVPE